MARHTIDGLMIIRWLVVWGVQGAGELHSNLFVPDA